MPADKFHEDFGRLIHLLTIDPAAADRLQELALEMNIGRKTGSGVDPETERQQHIALAKRKLDAAIHLYSEALIDGDEFVRRRESLEREIAHWESWTTETEHMGLELAMCIEAVDKLAYIWDHSDDEDRKGVVQNLFEWVEYDLDARRITNFRLKPWADRFIMLRGALYQAEKGNGGDDDDPGPGKVERVGTCRRAMRVRL